MFSRRRSVLSRWFVSRRSFIFVTEVVQGFASSLSAKRNCCQISLISQMQLHIKRQIQIPIQIHKHICNSGDSLFITLAMNHDFLKSADPLIKTSLNLTVVCFWPLRNCMEWNGLHFLFVHAPSLNRKRSVPLQMGSIAIAVHNHNLIHNFQIQIFYLTRICVALWAAWPCACTSGPRIVGGL